MKRSLELEEAVDEIIEKANTKDEQGRFVYDVMEEEPAIVMLFYARFALVEIIRDKPLRFLNLLQTSKKLNDFFGGFKDIWIILLDSFVESYASAYYSEIYPFFLIQNHRAREHGDTGSISLTHMMKTDYPEITKVVPVPQSYITLGKLHGGVTYYLVHHDELTKRYVDILQRVRDMRKWMRMPIDFYQYLKNYVGEDARLIAYYDYFLVDVAEPTLAYNKLHLYTNFKYIAEVIKSFEIMQNKDNLGWYNTTTRVQGYNNQTEYLTKDALELLQYLQKQVVKLEKFIQRTKAVEPIKIVPLDISTALPYRQMLFDKKEGVYYKTVEEQKKLFLDVLELAYPDKYSYGGALRKKFIEKFSAPFQCVSCHKETQTVDIKRLLPVCSIACREKLEL